MASAIDEKKSSLSGAPDASVEILPGVTKHDVEHGHVAEKILEHSHDADAALKAFASYEGSVIEIDKETNKRLLRKIDWHLMPVMCIVYGLNFLDKTTISYASVMGIKLPHSDNKLKSGINLTGDQYSWLGSMFYFGYLAWEYPTNRLLQRLPLGKYSSFNVVMWGLTLACFAAVENYEGALAVRFFLGLFESAVTPGFALLTSQWYTTSEQGTRTGIWFSFNGFAQVRLAILLTTDLILFTMERSKLFSIRASILCD